ncbi:DUF2190 family protein [Mycobacterium intracellulare]|uniref:capsid cement protein n=1 Tax=Mycobacterium intracellulare TaxID=1767 RepID=UPI001926060A|nr:capsid cement protein [Mycobacterium intracellulare]MCA2275498.1 DUF2190 family protein [Mycobacterium intracellulare]MCA2324458.1 DUF2190 family protein [Mycobacterium intracellulare]BCP29601.1 hypothetical protein MINTM026_05710 [Mycobacterium intracellulare]
MAGSDYVPLFLSGGEPTYTAAVAITGGQLVYISGDNAVSPTTAATAAWIGVAAQTVPAGAPVAVYTEGIHMLAASGAIAAGDVVIPAAAGAVATIGDDAVYTHAVGVATAAAANNQVPVKLTH